jgi:tetratricopeptide (TPR) repeat protein
VCVSESEDLRELRKDVAENHAVSTRTHNAVASLAASLKEVIVRQNRYERGLNLNSFIAYLLFTILLGGAFFLLYRSRADTMLRARDEAVRLRDEAVTKRDGIQRELTQRDDVARQATEFWQLLQSGKRAEAIAKYPEVSALPLSTVEAQVFQEGIARARNELVDAAHAAGLEAFRAEQWKRASNELKKALALEEEGARAAQMRYYLGVSLVKQGDAQEAARQLDLALGAGAERTVGGDGRYYLASALETLRQLDRARTEYQRFADAHPNHYFAYTARVKASQIARALATQPR